MQYQPPAIRIGVDFGAGTLVVGIAGEDGTGFHTIAFPGWSQEMPGTGSGGPVHPIPALIHYDQDGGRLIGDEVMRAGKAGDPATVRWIRRYLLDESMARIPAGTERQITLRDAATDFLTTILSRAKQECPGCTLVCFAIPGDAPDWYAGWLGGIATASGITSWHTLAELAAVCHGYGICPRQGEVYLILSWDETTIFATFAGPGTTQDLNPAGEIRVIGSAGDDTGSRDLDNWVAQDLFSRYFRKYTGLKAQELREAVLGVTGELFRQLAGADEARAGCVDPFLGTPVSLLVSRQDIDRILGAHEFLPVLSRTIDRARATVRARESCDTNPVAVLLTGRGFAIPAVQDAIKKEFAGIPVYCDHAPDAVARGAALYQPRTHRMDRINNDYALRYWDPKSREYRFRFLVRSGARYPSAGQVARITISAAYDGQTRLGLPVYEISTAAGAQEPVIDLVFDPAGGARLAGPPPDAGTPHRPVPVNDRTPTLLVADPPGTKGEPRFELTFTLDHEKRLCVTARDLLTGTLVKKNAPVHTLT